jgi:hypothetical protein
VESRTTRYRDIADHVRAKADNVPDEQTRLNMMRAAEIWDRLATVAERTFQTCRSGTAQWEARSASNVRH